MRILPFDLGLLLAVIFGYCYRKLEHALSLIIRNGLAADEHLRIVYGHTNAIICSAL
mgnify:CR=1 FL=1